MEKSGTISRRLKLTAKSRMIKKRHDQQKAKAFRKEPHDKNMFNVMLLTLFILWLLSCGLSAAAGYFIGCRPRSPRSIRIQPEPEESGKESRREREEANFLSYDGTPQPPIE